MGIRTLLYLFRLGLKNLWHHRVYTAASVITMSACIFLFLSLIHIYGCLPRL